MRKQTFGSKENTQDMNIPDSVLWSLFINNNIHTLLQIIQEIWKLYNLRNQYELQGLQVEDQTSNIMDCKLKM